MGYMKAEFEEFKEKYLNFSRENLDLVIFPNTGRSKYYLEKIVNDIKIAAILDNNKELEGKKYNNIPIYLAEDYLKQNKKVKILIPSYYSVISKQLDNLGYKEDVDYMDMHKYISMWYWENRQEIHLLDVHIAITTYCSLNCKNCNMFMNHYPGNKRKNISLEEFQSNVNNLLDNVDYCYKFTVLGGEPLLNKEWLLMVEWLRKEYGHKVGKIEIITNATIIPERKMFQRCSLSNISFAISNYGSKLIGKQKIEKIVGLLKECNIDYIVSDDMKWKDFYFPVKKQGAEFTSCREHMLTCNPIFRGLNDNKFYYCHIVWSANQAGIYREENTDFINISKPLNMEEKEELLAFDLGFMEKGYVSLCRYCGGCGMDNYEIIDAGIQE